MIAAVVDCSKSPANNFYFRDRECEFWLARFFSFCSFSPLPYSGADFDFIFIFAGDIFPVGPENAIQELRRWLKSQDSFKPWLVAPEKAPFFIASRAFLNREKISLRPGVFKGLQGKKKAVSLALKHPIHGYCPATEQRKIETFVIDLQISSLHKKGVRIEDYGCFYVDGFIPIGRNTQIGSGVVIKGESAIGKNVRIYPNCFIENSRIGDDCLILPGTVICDSTVEKAVQLGPYCHLRNGSLVKKGAKIGNFVEIKKSILGQGSKAMHLTYIGDARVGKKTNIGAGTITCNYDGEKKNPTCIGDNVFIGSGTELVAPVTVHSGSYIAAGSTITEDVPQNALAVARQRQKNISGWVLRKRNKKK
jgi:bifunctional N-acetylglucosamine-1-phosphate-uridyltransferase/glucosamine-1-phosphate-acetyltransferase GlmU-like protein